MDRLDAMAVLLKVVDRGSFSAAGRELGLPLATVSRNVAELEARLGTKLLQRTTRSITLTDAGLLYVPAARRILDEVQETERQAAGEYRLPRGELLLTAPLLFGRLHVLPIVTEFLAAHPEINISIAFADRNLHLLNEHVDIAVRIGALPDSGQVAIRVGTMRTVVCASPQFLASHGTPTSPADLRSLPSVSFGFLSPASAWQFKLRGAPPVQEIHVSPRLTTSTAEAAVWAAIEGTGVTRVLHYQCADAVKKGELRIILREHEPDPVPVHLLHNEGRTPPLKTRSFLHFATSRLRQQLAALSHEV